MASSNNNKDASEASNTATNGTKEAANAMSATSSNGHQSQQSSESTTTYYSKDDFARGRADDGAVIYGSLRPKYIPKQSPAVIGIQGKWYDATKFAAHHPGGDIIYEFNRKDATAQFLAYHSFKILEKYKLPLKGEYDFDDNAPGGSSLQGAWMKLNAQFEGEGRYDPTPLSWLAKHVAILVVCFAVMFPSIRVYNEYGSILAFTVGAMCMAMIWQQSGFLMHDTMHNHMFHDRKKDARAGFIFGNILLGVGGRWWRDEHNEHHVFTNAIVEGVGPADPQMIEDIWIQDERLVPYFVQCTVKFILEYQQYYFVPILIVVGLFPIKVDAITHTTRYWEDFVGLGLHIAWVGGTISLLPSSKERAIFYVLSNMFSGCLGVQLLVSHYAKPWVDKVDTKDAGSWAGRQVEAVMDITCPIWLDWFHGGLHIHSVHHMFPRMCRSHYRAVYDDIMQMCEEHGLPVDRSPWLEAIGRCVQHLSTVKDKVAKLSTDPVKPKSE
jgi:delta8-fatty-acid desaturase